MPETTPVSALLRLALQHAERGFRYELEQITTAGLAESGLDPTQWTLDLPSRQWVKKEAPPPPLPQAPSP